METHLPYIFLGRRHYYYIWYCTCTLFVPRRQGHRSSFSALIGCFGLGCMDVLEEVGGAGLLDPHITAMQSHEAPSPLRHTSASSVIREHQNASPTPHPHTMWGDGHGDVLVFMRS